ncbi:TetR/AcrR family transcriptional regulator [Gordonia sp. NPDC003424]
MTDAREVTAGRSTARRELVERQILDQAFALFASKGYARTTLQDIAAATGLTRPALYHYISNKDELIEKLIAEIAGHSAEVLHRINADSADPPDVRLRAMCRAMAEQTMSGPDRFRLLISSENDLPPAVVDSYRERRRAVLRELIEVIDEGQVARIFRPCDSRVAALGIIGMLNWIAWWYHPGDRDDEDRIAAQLADMAIRTVIDPDPAAEPTGGPLRIIESVREQLAELEQALSDDL